MAHTSAGPLRDALAAYRETLSQKDGRGKGDRGRDRASDRVEDQVLIRQSAPRAPAAATPAPAAAGRAAQTPAAQPPAAPHQAGGLIRQALPQAPASSREHRAAQFLVLIGSEEAAKILARLDPAQVEAISREILSITSIKKDEAEAVLAEFSTLFHTTYAGSGAVSGGPEAARRLLYAAFGPEKGESLFGRVSLEPEGGDFSFLEDWSGEQIAFLFKDESPAAEAMVLSRLPPLLAAQTLARTDAPRKLEVARRIARMGEVPPEALSRTAAALREKARRIGKPDTARVDGLNALTSILKASDTRFGEHILRELEAEDPALSASLKDKLFTLDDVADAMDRPIEEKLQDMSDTDICLLTRGRSDAFRAKIFSNLSRGREARVREEDRLLGPVSRNETEAAARDFLSWFRKGREAGTILMKDANDVLL
ncbi:MAG: flagellar motor switch protein FliG [Treponema sp.]|jgi:flagellar motor switch protein FliG|nr:flagellar motor switch protein FliG [Treponema sp.]